MTHQGVTEPATHADEHTVTKPTPPTPWWATNSTTPHLSRTQVTTITPRGALTLGTLITCFTAGLWALLITTAPQQITRADGGLLAHQQTNEALIGGCGPLYSYPNATTGSGTVPNKNAAGISNRLGYNTTVPMRGQFWDTPITRPIWMPDAQNKPVAEQILRNLWDGDMVAYYTPALPTEDITNLAQLARTRPELRLLVVPWEQRLRGPLPGNRALALVAWNTSQTCHALSVPALHDFRTHAPANTAPGYDGTKPPVLRRTPPIGVNVE